MLYQEAEAEVLREWWNGRERAMCRDVYSSLSLLSPPLLPQTLPLRLLRRL